VEESGIGMGLKLVSGLMLTTLLVSMLFVVFDVGVVVAPGTIYIRADGSIDPPTANITSVDNVTYTFTSNINDSIVVERDDIVVDGAGYTVQGTGAMDSKGIHLTGSNVTIKNMTIKNFWEGISLGVSRNSVISGNNITNNSRGMHICGGSGNTVISGNNITNNSSFGIKLCICFNITIFGNNITNNTYDGIIIIGYPNSIFENNITNNKYGISLFSWDNVIYHNNFVNNTYQVIPEFEDANVWDDGYPSGGNYWSDYNGTDLYSGSDQIEIGSDGIGDTPYIIDTNNTDRYPLMKPYGGPHDIGITSVTTSKTIIAQGNSLSIGIKIINYGVETETFNVTAYANTTVIATFTNITLPSRKLTTLTFTWNTTGFDIGNYTMSAVADVVTNETDILDNIYIDGIVKVRLPIHDIAVEVTPSKTVVGQDCSLKVNVTAANQGDYTETFNVTVYANTTIIETKTNITLTGENSTTLTFTWNISGFAKGKYIIKAVADTVLGETDIEDNTFIGTVQVAMLCDITADGKVNVYDLRELSKAYGSKIGDAKYNANADINCDEKINIYDLRMLARNYGKTDP